jgi:hypothetical protein
MSPSWAQKRENWPEVEGWLESIELLHFLTVSKNDSMNLIVGYVISYDCCGHHRADANELLTYILYLAFIPSNDLAMCLIKARISDGGTHAQLSQRVRNGR